VKNKRPQPPMMSHQHLTSRMTARKPFRFSWVSGESTRKLIAGVYIAVGAGTIFHPSESAFALGSPGDIYITGASSPTITEISPKAGSVVGTFAAASSNLQGIAFGTNGNLYASGYPGTLYSFNVSTGTVANSWPDGNTDSYGLAAGNGLLYATNGSFGPPWINVLNQSGGSLGTYSTTAETFSPWNYGDVVGPDKNLYVAERHNAQVVEYNTSNGTSSLFVGGTPPMNQDGGLAFNSAGDLFVSGTYASGAGGLCEYSPGGTLLNSWSGGAFVDPIGIAFGSNGDLYVANLGGGDVLDYQISGSALNLVQSISTPGVDPYFLAVTPSAVPEPTSLGLLAIGTVGLLRRKRRCRRVIT
jgi:hypothetical protein